MHEAIELLPVLELPEPTVLSLEQFADALALHRDGRALKVVLTP